MAAQVPEDEAPERDRQPPTERANPRSAGLDTLPVEAALELMLAEDRRAVEAVGEARREIASAIELVADRLAAGGRLFYVGAGTSGRLGALDAAECPPTFGTDPELVQAIVAGGERALTRAVEGAEDSTRAGALQLEARRLGPRDVVVGISASGTTPYVQGALAYARRKGAAVVLVTCTPEHHAPADVDVAIRLATGPECVAGSTRLKAGTATKLVLNAISTLAMARLGRVLGNRMVAFASGANKKLRRRARSLVAELGGVDAERAERLLDEAGGEVPLAVLAARTGERIEACRERLARAGGSLREALKQLEQQA